MDSRSKILMKLTQPANPAPLPEIDCSTFTITNAEERFRQVLVAIGGAVIEVGSLAGVAEFITQHYASGQRIVSAIPALGQPGSATAPAVGYDDVELVILQARFGVAENGAVWIPDSSMPHPVLPFICQHLIVVLERGKLVPHMHEAYRVIDEDYSFGAFIAGPSKTADIEQSLVLGAHGPKTLTLFLVGGGERKGS